MSTGERVEIPERARALIEKLLRERERIDGQIEAVVAGVRAALGVPEGYVLRTLEEGFVEPTGEEA